MSHPGERERETRASDIGGGVAAITCVAVEVRNASCPAAAQPRPIARGRSSRRCRREREGAREDGKEATVVVSGHRVATTSIFPPLFSFPFPFPRTCSFLLFFF
ncbi:uncharacterized protein DS421_11g348250 [Arachis hypogaea]|nr:uncharacterized protein DS421_11g348250 [Arachis hypogaea]